MEYKKVLIAGLLYSIFFSTTRHLYKYYINKMLFAKEYCNEFSNNFGYYTRNIATLLYIIISYIAEMYKLMQSIVFPEDAVLFVIIGDFFCVLIYAFVSLIKESSKSFHK
jgi:hypothetical protein